MWYILSKDTDKKLYKIRTQTLETVRPPFRLGKWYVQFERPSNSKSEPGENIFKSLLDFNLSPVNTFCQLHIVKQENICANFFSVSSYQTLLNVGASYC